MELIDVADAPPDPLPPKPSPKRIQSGDPKRIWSGDFFICQNPNCDFQGRPLRKSNGSVFVLVLLILLPLPIALFINVAIELSGVTQFIGTGTLIGVGMFLIGIAYSAALSGYRCICPKCGMTLRK